MKITVNVDEYMRTAEPGLYAIGDIVRTPWLAPLALPRFALAASAGGAVHRSAGQHQALALQQLAQLRHAGVERLARLHLVTAEHHMRLIAGHRHTHLHGLAVAVQRHLGALVVLVDPEGNLLGHLFVCGLLRGVRSHATAIRH